MNQYVFNIPNDNTTIRLYGEGNTAWGDGTTDSLNEHIYSSAGVYTVNTDLYISNRKAVNRYERDKDTISYLIAASIDLNYIKELEEIEKMYFFFNLFNGCSNLQTVEFTNSITINTQVKTCYMFNNCSKLNKITGLTNIHLNNLIDMNNMFNNCIILKDSSIDVTSFKSIKENDFKYAFRNCRELVKITLPVSNNFTPASGLSAFEGCTKLVNVYNLNYYSITNARSMFYQCTSMVSAPVMFIYDCKDASFMFQGCTNLSNIHNNALNFTNVLDMNVEGSVTLDTKFFTPKRCRCMFAGCHKLEKVDLSYMNLTEIETLENRPDLIMDESIFSKIDEECNFYSDNYWNAPINFSHYGINNIDTYTEFSRYYDVINDPEDASIYIVSNSKLHTGIFFTDPMNFIECYNTKFYFSEEDNIEYNKNINGTNYAVARRLRYYKSNLLPSIIELNLYVYKNTEKKIIRKTAIFTSAKGTIKYKIKGGDVYNPIKINAKNDDGYYLALPTFNDRYTNTLVPESELSIKITEYDNYGNVTGIENRFDSYIHYRDSLIEITYPLCKVDSIKFKNNKYVKEINECSGIYNSIGWYNPSSNYREAFYGCNYLESIDKSFFKNNVIHSEIADLSYMFADCWSLTSLDLKDIYSFYSIPVSNISYMFYGCSSLTSLDLSDFKTHTAYAMEYTFFDCSSLMDIKGLLNWQVENVTHMSGMFRDCSSLTSLDLHNWYTSKANYMSYMFSGCSSLTSLDLSNFDTNNVYGMENMFYNVPTTVNWNYDNGPNYYNFTLTEDQTGYSGTFPWNE